MNIDFVFEEDKSWDQDKSHEGAINADLEWGDSEDKTSIIDANEEDRSVDNTTNATNERNDNNSAAASI